MKKGISRRDMLRLSATAGISSLIIPGQMNAGEKSSLPQESTQIPLRTLGRTGMQLPILSMGVNRSDNPNVLRAAYNAGIVHFDCGHVYQNGKSEEMIGKILGDKPRLSLNIATKAMFDYPLRDNFEEIMLQQLDTSLKRMKMEYVDIFYAHSVSFVEKLTHPRVLALLEEIKREGKARFIGFSSHDQNNELLKAAMDIGIYDVAMITYNFKIENRAETEELIEKAARSGMGIIAMKVMAGGTEDAEGKKKIDGKACLKWVWQNPYITTVLPSVANYDELDNSLEAVQELELTQAEKDYLVSIEKKQTLFCQQCGICKEQCPEKLPVPDIMRAYMYAYGYKYARLSKETLKLAGVNANICMSCDSCKVVCPSGFQVEQKVAAIKQLVTTPDIFLT